MKSDNAAANAREQEDKLTRRRFVQQLSATGVLLCASSSPSFAGDSTKSTPLLYYMDGYHGGVRGHMPQGCWRDILDAMERNPDWKLSLDVEADSWAVLARQDPDTFRRLKKQLDAQGDAGRLEITGGTFAQPYGWAISGESNIRQLGRGLELIRKAFPHARVMTYAVQEPCWASCLPQILRSFGFTGASLKNASTAWGGYTRGFDAELVNWIGPDRTSLLAVPRYEEEGLLHVWETEATEVTEEYAERCVEHGIPQPAGMCFQDLGWAAQPRVRAPWVRFATWGEYLHKEAKSAPVDWKFSMEDILTALPWGEKTLHRASRQVHEAEAMMVRAEKHAAMQHLHSRTPWPAERLQHAWDQTLWSQAHDAWITVTTRSGREAWAFQVASETLDAVNTAQALIDAAVSDLCHEPASSRQAGAGTQWVRAVHLSGAERSRLIDVTVTADPGTEAFSVTSADGRKLPAQVIVQREYRKLSSSEGMIDPVMEQAVSARDAASSINTAKLLFRDQLPSFGWSTFRVEALQQQPAAAAITGLTMKAESDGSVVLESDLYRIRFDAHSGGAMTSLYAKSFGREYCPKDAVLNAFRGYFVSAQRWASSAEQVARIEITEAGPVRGVVQITGVVAGVPFRSRVSVVQGEMPIRCEASFRFESDTLVGDPWQIKPEDRMRERRRSSNNGSMKLQASFPVAIQDGVLDKSSAFDVCRSRLSSTTFERWDEIKHNIITNWVDLLDDCEQVGFAVFTDRTTAYSYGKTEPLGLVLGWGGEAGFWWGNCPLRGEQESKYAIVPHRGNWADAGLPAEYALFEDPVAMQVMDGSPLPRAMSHSWLQVEPPQVSLSSVIVDGDALQIRLFHASPKQGICHLRLSFPVLHAHVVELDGRIAQTLTVEHESQHASVQCTMPPFGIRTIRVERTAYTP